MITYNRSKSHQGWVPRINFENPSLYHHTVLWSPGPVQVEAACVCIKIDLHFRIATVLHQGFPWLKPFTIFWVPTFMLCVFSAMFAICLVVIFRLLTTFKCHYTSLSTRSSSYSVCITNPNPNIELAPPSFIRHKVIIPSGYQYLFLLVLELFGTILSFFRPVYGPFLDSFAISRVHLHM